MSMHWNLLIIHRQGVFATSAKLRYAGLLKGLFSKRLCCIQDWQYCMQDFELCIQGCESFIQYTQDEFFRAIWNSTLHWSTNLSTWQVALKPIRLKDSAFQCSREWIHRDESRSWNGPSEERVEWNPTRPWLICSICLHRLDMQQVDLDAAISGYFLTASRLKVS